MSNLRWKVITVLAVFVIFAAVGVYPLIAQRYGITSPSWLMDRALKLGLDLKGGVHLVLRVQTDDALRQTTLQEMERLREALKTRNITVGNIDATDPVHFKVEGVAPAQDAAFREVAAEVSANFERDSGSNGTYTFTMRPNIQVNLRDESVVQARQTIERRVNELGVTEPSIAQQGRQGDRILVQLPGVTDVNRAKEIIRSTGLLELKIVEQGPSATKEALLTGGQVPQGMEVVPGASGTTGDARHCLLPRQEGRGGHRDGPDECAAVGRREQPAGRGVHAEQRRRAQVRQGDQREHRETARDHPRRPRPVGADASKGASRARAASPAASRRKKCRTCR